MALERVAVAARRDVKRSHRRLTVGGLLLVCLMTIVLAVVTRAFIVQTFKIPSTSMVPTLLVGDLIVVNKLAYGLALPGKRLFRGAGPQRGEVVVFYRFSEFEDLDAEKHYIKRIAAVPGDIVEVKDYITYVNNEPVQLQSADWPPAMSDLGDLSGRSYGPVKLREGEYFALGDNTANSKDSRYFGPISLSDIQGRAVAVYWSWNVDSDSRSVRWERIGMRIQ